MARTSVPFSLRTTLASGLLGLAACNPIPPTPATAQAPVARVAEVELSHTVYFDTDAYDLRPAEADALRDFAATVGNSFTLDNIVIGHADVRAGDEYNDALSDRRATTVAEILAAEGVAPEQMTRHALGRRRPVTGLDDETAWRLSRRVEIVAHGIVVVEPNCPDWSRPSAMHPANLPTSNFGCATSVNLVRMIADPRDLVRGLPVGPNDPARAAGAVNRYRLDDIKPLRMEASSR